ncbi:uncharacterized protein STEHIDRAFT_160227 [Stereum hirsutum FP-91666 SS1]|uniref:uncharacterized protein n=1 Tax=Stereum hirsutum (strain FP-91666) TaxID=721885 RepID=UPI000444A01C|nr:uncharacterized protein STEHIDRAFT_160227 [Stereum hirsutum FP-91666 SS1]EIM83651.1 hypothetical protein STEHIDRAFT_160227 [Stereum hirsutum FP-91666 SS1]
MASLQFYIRKPQSMRLFSPPQARNLSQQERFEAVHAGLGLRRRTTALFRKVRFRKGEEDLFYSCCICFSSKSDENSEENRCNLASICDCKILLHIECAKAAARHAKESVLVPKCPQCRLARRWVHIDWLVSRHEQADIRRRHRLRQKQRKKTNLAANEKEKERKKVQRRRRNAAERAGRLNKAVEAKDKRAGI